MSSPNSFWVIFVVSGIIFFCRSVCLMWQCVTPSNFQTSTSRSRRYLADTPYSPISTLLSPPSAIIIFHFSLIHLDQIAAAQLSSLLLSWLVSSVFDPIRILIILPHIYEFVLHHRHCWRPIHIYTNWSNYILPSQTYEFVLYINIILSTCIYELVPLGILSTHIYEFDLYTNNIQFGDIL